MVWMDGVNGLCKWRKMDDANGVLLDGGQLMTKPFSGGKFNFRLHLNIWTGFSEFRILFICLANQNAPCHTKQNLQITK